MAQSDLSRTCTSTSGGYVELFGSVFAVPGVAEKGYLDTVSVSYHLLRPGKRDSHRTLHVLLAVSRWLHPVGILAFRLLTPYVSYFTVSLLYHMALIFVHITQTIGILSASIVALEDDQFPAHLTRSSPVYDTMLCTAAHADEVPEDLRKLIESSVYSDGALDQLQDLIIQDEDTTLKNSIRTTLAATVIGDGFKANALPEDASAIVNYRIASYRYVARLFTNGLFCLPSWLYVPNDRFDLQLCSRNQRP